jgi:dienelactone hydrolase
VFPRSRTETTGRVISSVSIVLLFSLGLGCSAGSGSGASNPPRRVGSAGSDADDAADSERVDTSDENVVQNVNANTAPASNSGGDDGNAGPLPAPVVPGGVPLGQVVERTEPSTGALYRLYLPASFPRPQELPVVVSFHGTDGSAQTQMGPDTESLIYGGHDFGGPTWPQVAEQSGFTVLVPHVQFGLRRPDGTVDWSQCAMRRDLADLRAILAELEGLGVIGMERYATGFSSGGSLSFFMAFANPTLFRGIVIRHSHLAPCTDPACHVFSLADYQLNVVPFTADAFGPDGECMDGEYFGDGYDWKADPRLRDIRIHVISGDMEGLEDAPAHSYFNNTQIFFDAMATQLGYDPANLTQQVFPTPAGEDAFANCTLTTDPNYPHYCHAQDRDLTAEWLFGTP